MDRRKFLKTTTAGGTLIAIGIAPQGCGNNVSAAPLATAKVITTVTATTVLGAEATLIDDASASDYGTLTLVPPFYTDLAKVGGAITILLPVDANDQNRAYPLPPENTVLVVQTGASSFAAFQSSCPHAACPLGYSAKDQLIECPCHSSRFYPTDNKAGGTCAGQVAHPPSNAPLQTWKTTLTTPPGEPPRLTIDLKSPLLCNNDFPALVGTTLTLPFADFPQLAMPGGSAAGLPMGATDPIVVIRVDATKVAALDAKCTHRGCTVMYNAKKIELDCPCHGSVFGLDGKVLAPPAPSPLHTYTATLMSDSIVVNVV